MTSWVKRKYYEDKALDTAMASVIDYYQFSSMKAPPRPEDIAIPLSSPSPPHPAPVHAPLPPSSLSSTSPPSSLAATPSSSFTPTPSPPFTYAEWQSERAEMLALDQCAFTATWRMLSTSALTGTVAMVWRHYQGRSKLGMAMSGVGVAIFTTAVTWNVWGKACANDFLTSEGRVAERGRAALRKEMDDHPLLVQYQEKHGLPSPSHTAAPSSSS